MGDGESADVRSDSRSSRRGASSGTSPTERCGLLGGTSRCVVPCSPMCPGTIRGQPRVERPEVCGPSRPSPCPACARVPVCPGVEPAKETWHVEPALGSPGGVSGVRGIPSHTPPGSRTLKVNSFMCPVTGDDFSLDHVPLNCCGLLGATVGVFWASCRRLSIQPLHAAVRIDERSPNVPTSIREHHGDVGRWVPGGRPFRGVLRPCSGSAARVETRVVGVTRRTLESVRGGTSLRPIHSSVQTR